MINAKKYELKNKQRLKTSKFYQNENFDFLTTCQEFKLANCNPLQSLKSCTYLQTAASVLLYRRFSSNLVEYLVAFGDITWKLSKQNFVVVFLRDSVLFNQHSSLNNIKDTDAPSQISTPARLQLLIINIT